MDEYGVIGSEAPVKVEWNSTWSDSGAEDVLELIIRDET